MERLLLNLSMDILRARWRIYIYDLSSTCIRYHIVTELQAYISKLNQMKVIRC